MKLKLLSIIVLLCSNVLLFSQSKFNLELTASPNYSHKTTKSNSDDFEVNKEDYNAKFGSTFSLKIGYKLGEKTSLISGLEHNNKGYKIDLHSVGVSEPIFKNASLNYNYLEVPLYFKYTMYKKKLEFSPIGGFSYGRLISLTARVNKNIGKVTDFQDRLENINVINVHIGFEMAYPISDRIKVKLEPKFDYSLSDFYKGKDKLIVKEHAYIIGCNSGIIIDF